MSKEKIIYKTIGWNSIDAEPPLLINLKRYSKINCIAKRKLMDLFPKLKDKNQGN